MALVLGAAALLGFVRCGDDDDEAVNDEPAETTEADAGSVAEPTTDGRRGSARRR